MVSGPSETVRHALDLADYEPLLPRRWKKRIGTTLLLFALLSPSQFRDMFIAQVERHAQHLTTEFLKVMLPDTTASTPAQAPDPAPHLSLKQAGSKR